MSNLKNLNLLIFILLVSTVAVFTASCVFTASTGPEEESVVEIDQPVEDKSDNLAEEEFEQLLESENFLETFNTFYYPDASVKQASLLKDEQEMVYVILDTDESFETVEDYYKNKRIQSIWKRDFIYQKNMADIEEDFIEVEDKNIEISKFTFSSSNRDKVVDILIKNLDEGRTQIMITFWDLK